MRSKIDVLRAVMAAVSQRALTLATILGGVILTIAFLLIWALAHFASDWWWLLLILYIPLLFIGLIIWLIARFLVKRLYPRRISSEQKALLGNFTDKIQHLLETRGMGWPMFALLNIKDLLFHRELRTTKKLISDTTSLKKDLSELEEKLQA